MLCYDVTHQWVHGLRLLVVSSEGWWLAVEGGMGWLSVIDGEDWWSGVDREWLSEGGGEVWWSVGLVLGLVFQVAWYVESIAVDWSSIDGIGVG